MGKETTTVTEMTDILCRDGSILHVCPTQEAAMGLAAGEMTGAPWSDIYPLPSRERLEGLFAQTRPGPYVVRLDLRRATGGQTIATTAVATLYDDADHGACLRLVKWRRGGALDDVARLAEENEILSSILAASDDAGWCMEWREPLDLSAPEQEIVRQVFENGPRWRFCNDAMARLYRTPEGEDFNLRPVHETFQRSPENETFVRSLIRANFDVNGAPSRDLRYDGMYIEVENDVRGHIRGNRLYRMWGTVRDVSKHARRAAGLREEIDTLRSIIEAVPDAVLVVDRDGIILRINLAAEELLHVTPDILPERNLKDLIDLPSGLSALFSTASTPVSRHPTRIFPVGIPAAGSNLRAELTARPLTLRGNDYLVLSLRPRVGSAGTDETRDSLVKLRAER